jgi:hypothetical protein
MSPAGKVHTMRLDFPDFLDFLEPCEYIAQVVAKQDQRQRQQRQLRRHPGVVVLVYSMLIYHTRVV